MIEEAGVEEAEEEEAAVAAVEAAVVEAAEGAGGGSISEAKETWNEEAKMESWYAL